MIETMQIIEVEMIIGFFHLKNIRIKSNKVKGLGASCITFESISVSNFLIVYLFCVLIKREIISAVE